MPGNPSQAQNTLVSNTVSTFIMGPNPRRIAVTFFPSATNRVTLGFGIAAVQDISGPVIQPQQPPYRISVENAGEIIQQGINGIAAAAPTALGWIEEMSW